MTKLPFFKFTIAEWMLGRIQRLPLDTKGAFVDLMCMYWHNECDYTVQDAETDIGGEHIEYLEDRGIIQIDGEYIVIEFLDAQFSDCKDVSKVRSAAGRLGGLAKAKQLPSKKKQTRQEEDKTRKDNTKANAYVKWYNETYKRNFKVTDKLITHFNARLQDGYKFEDFQKAIDNAHKDQFHKDSNHKHLNPLFFTRADKLEHWSNVTPKVERERTEGWYQ